MVAKSRTLGNLHVFAFSVFQNLQIKICKMSIGKANIKQLAPEFTATALVGEEFKTVSLRDYRGKYVLVFFYPKDFTFVCPTEIIAFSDRVKEFHAIDCEVIACSIDTEFCHLAWVNTPRKLGGLGKMNIPILSDKNATISKTYGIYNEEEGCSLRASFIIDPQGILRQITVNDFPVGRSVDETLRLIQAFQFTDKHGEVCPANWKPGSDTIDTNNKLQYFKNQ